MADNDYMSVGSVISLRSVSEGLLESARSTTNKKKSKKSSGSPYGTPKKTLPKKHAKKTGREVWVNAIQNGAGMSAESTGMNTWAFGKPNNAKNRSTASNFLMEQLNLPAAKQRPSSATARVGGTGPVYKDAETYYDEIQILKRTLKQAKNESVLLKVKNNRLNDELMAKSRKIEELLNPDTQSNDLRRTLGSKKPDVSEVVMSLRRKIHKLEENLRSKENEVRSINSDLKVTNIEELRFENEIYLFEVQRLNHILQESQNNARTNAISNEAINEALRDGNGSKTQLIIKRLTEDNHGLVLENKSLKNDLMKLTTPIPGEGVNLEKDYEDMNRQELIQKMINLEQRLKEEESNQPLKAEEHVDSELIDERCIELKGPLPQQIKQLRDRERELLGDVERLESSVKKLKEDRSHYRKMTDDYRQQLDQLDSNKSKEIKEELVSDSASVKSGKTIKITKSSAEKTSSVASGSLRRSSTIDSELRTKVRSLQEQNAAKKIQRGWRNRQGKNEKQKDGEEDELEEAIISVQSAWRGHQTRAQYLNSTIEKNNNLNDNDVLLIQSAYRGHVARKQALNNTSPRLSGRHRANMEADQREVNLSENESDDDDDVVIGSSVSLSRYRDTDHSKRTPTRNPKIYSDPDARPYTGERFENESRSGRSNGYQGSKSGRSNDYRDSRSGRSNDYRDSRNGPSNDYRDSRSGPSNDYRDLRSGSQNRPKNLHRDFSGFLSESDSEERVRGALSQRFRDGEDEKNKSTKVSSVNKLKSNSSPWSKSPHEIDTEDDSLSASHGSSNKSSGKRNESRPSREGRVNVKLQDKWARSGSENHLKQPPEKSRSLAVRKSSQHINDFQHAQDDDDDEEEDIIVAPSFQNRLRQSVKKRQGLDDELF